MKIENGEPRANEHITCACDNDITLCNLRYPGEFSLEDDAEVSCVTCAYLDTRFDFCVTGKCL